MFRFAKKTIIIFFVVFCEHPTLKITFLLQDHNLISKMRVLSRVHLPSSFRWSFHFSPKKMSEEEEMPVYSARHMATVDLRFSVRDEVQCYARDGSTVYATVVQRFYREDNWKPGCFAAVRTIRNPLSPSAY